MILVVRLAAGMLTLIVSSALVFFGVYLAPGSPLDVLLGDTQVSGAQRLELMAHYGLDRPVLERYGVWVSNVVSGDLGTSTQYNREVTSLIGARLETTGLLLVYALLLTVILGVIWGAVGAVRGGKTDVAVVLTTSVGWATPSFVGAILLIALFAVHLDWFPGQGVGDSFVDQLWHLTLPAVAIATHLAALVARITRTAFLQELSSEHVVTARSRGFAESHVVRRHVARNAMMPIVTIVGLITANLIGGTIVVEQVFALNGIGSMLIQAISAHDFPVVQAISLFIVAAFVGINFAVDMVYVALDPRLRRASANAR